MYSIGAQALPVSSSSVYKYFSSARGNLLWVTHVSPPSPFFSHTHTLQPHRRSEFMWEQMSWKNTHQVRILLSKHGTFEKTITPIFRPLNHKLYISQYGVRSPDHYSRRSSLILSLISCFYPHISSITLAQFGKITTSEPWPNFSEACWEYRRSNMTASCLQSAAPVCLRCSRSCWPVIG